MNYPTRIEAGSGGRSPDGGARFRTRGRWRRPGRNIKDDVDDLPYCHSLPMQDRSRFIPRFCSAHPSGSAERCGDFGKTAKRNNQVFSNEINEVRPPGQHVGSWRNEPTRGRPRRWRNNPSRGQPRHLAKQTQPAAGRAPDFCKTNYVFPNEINERRPRSRPHRGLAVRLRSTRWIR
jgi:hypothetical protein